MTIGWLALAGFSAALLAVPWLIYPWLTLKLAPPRSAAPHAPRAETGISLVVATRESPEAVRARLLDLLAGDWPAGSIDLIVAVDGDPGGYRFEDLAPAPHRVQVVVAQPPGGKASALNAGVDAATTELVVFADTQQRFDRAAIPRLVAALTDGTFGAVSGSLRLGNEADQGSMLGRYWGAERRLREAESRMHSTIGVSGSIYAMRRALWTPLPASLILDDLWVPMHLAMRGHRVGFEPGAEATDVRSTTPQQEFQRKVRTLTGNLQLVAWMPAVLLPWRNPVWMQFLCHKLLRLVTPYALAGLGIGILGAAFSVGATLGWILLGTGAAAALLGMLWPAGLGARFRHALGWVVVMQGAILVATWNGLRGRWDVWKR